MLDESANNPHGVDLNKILVKVTYLGLAVGFTPPGAYVIMAYEAQLKLVSEGKFSTRKSKFFPPTLFKWP